MRRWFVLIPLLGACPAPDPQDEGPQPFGMPAADEDPGEILSDVQHLLGEAVAEYEAGERAGAEQAWTLATAIFRERLLPTIRATDRLKALELEVSLGRFGDALRRGGTKPAAQQKELDRALEGWREALARPPSEAAPPTPAP